MHKNWSAGSFPIETVTFAFRSKGKTSANCGNLMTMMIFKEKLKSSSSPRIVHWRLHREGCHGRVTVHKALITNMNVHLRVQWRKDHWSTDMWDKVNWSDQSSFTLFLTSGWEHVWFIPRQRYAPECLTPTVRWCGDSVTLWRNGLGPLVCKVVLSDHLYLTMKRFYLSCSRMTMH